MNLVQRRARRGSPASIDSERTYWALCGGVRVVGELGAVIVVGRDLFFAHAVGGEPARNMNVAEALPHP